MAQAFGQNSLAIFAYGPLPSDPGDKIRNHIIAQLTRPALGPIEYVRLAKLAVTNSGAHSAWLFSWRYDKREGAKETRV